MESDLLASLGPANYLRTRADILVSPSSGVRCYNCVACVCWALQESFPFPALTFRTSSFLWLCSSPHPSRPQSCSPLPVLSPLPSRKHYLFGQSGQISLDCGENKTKHIFAFLADKIFPVPLTEKQPFFGVERRAAKNLWFCPGVQEGAREALFVELRREKCRSQKPVSSLVVALERAPKTA